MFVQWKVAVATRFAIGVFGMNAGVAAAQQHNHSHNGGNSAQLTLDHGKKWATDESLRQGMSRIRVLWKSSTRWKAMLPTSIIQTGKTSNRP